MPELIAYIDESGTHDGSPITIMAAWVGYADRWKSFEKQWWHLLHENKIEYIHGLDLRHGTKIFKDRTRWPLDRRLALSQAASGLAEEYARYSVSVLLKNTDFDRYYVAPDQRKHRGPTDSKYGVCFRLMLSVLAQMVQKYEAPGSQVRIVLEDGHKNRGAPQEILREFKEVYGEELAPLIADPIGYALKKQTPGVQAADLLAYPVFSLERDNKAEFEEVDLLNVDHLPPERAGNYRAEITPETLRDFKEGQAALARARRIIKRERRRSNDESTVP